MIRILVPVLVALCAFATAHAHRQPEVETTIETVQTDAGPALGLTHRLHAHDAMTLLRALGVRQPDLTEAAHLARLATYAAENVRLTGTAASEPLGAEVEGNYVFAYVRHPEVAAVESATLLAGIAPGWRNTVHLKDEDGTTRHSVTFNADRTVLAAPLSPGSLPDPDIAQVPDHAH